MEFLMTFFGMRKLKPYKVQDAERKTRFGIAASSLSDLKKKGMSKLKLKGKINIVLEEDGTSIDSEEYFQTLPPQTVFVFLTSEENWDGYITYLKLAMEKISENIMAGNQTFKEIQEILQGHESPETSVLVEYVNSLQANIPAEDKDDDPLWFEGLQKNLATKDMAMRHAAKARMRGYLSKVREYVGKSSVDQKYRKSLEQITDLFQDELKAHKYNSSYFSRQARKQDRLCTTKGWFYCDGPYNAVNCDSSHSINPYGTKDARILFSTWNLDHRIEKNREILPRLVEAVVNCPRNNEINWKYFYQLLFTKANLGLVEIRCHLKERHDDLLVDSKKIYM